ncbi:MAG: inorganic phosphate transporter [Thermoplasmata archaeon]
MVGVGIGELILVALALAFAWSIGAHYTGACMGMAFAMGAVRRGPALVGMALLTFFGAALASGRVVENVGLNLVASPSIPLAAAAVVVGSAFALTSLYNIVRVPTSTIQILVFSLIGVALAIGIPIHAGTLAGMVAIWVSAPFVAFGLGFVLTRGFDRVAPHRAGGSPGATTLMRAAPWLVVMGLIASFAMGANDVANATAVFVSTGVSTVLVAGIVGGIALALGVVTWGSGLLATVAFDVVRLDRSMATAAQFSQALVILSSVVFFGAFTSMNQALIGAMAGAGLARGRATLRPRTLRGILVGWALGPLSGLAMGAGAMTLVALVLPCL